MCFVKREVHIASATIRFPQTEMGKVSKNEARVYTSAMDATKNPDFSKCATLGLFFLKTVTAQLCATSARLKLARSWNGKQRRKRTVA